jgi:hypothetical protein
MFSCETGLHGLSKPPSLALTGSNTESPDDFGVAVAVSSARIVIGAEGEKSNGTGVNSGAGANNSLTFAGAAYIFKKIGGVWSEEAYVKASNTAGYDHFGASVAISGSTVLVGAWGKNFNTGAVYVFTLYDGQFEQEAILLGGETRALGISGNTAVIGDYVFTRSNATWTLRAHLTSSNFEAADAFGYRAAIDNDVIVLGAPGEDSNATGANPGPTAETDNSASGSGAAYIFSGFGPFWTQ